MPNALTPQVNARTVVVVAFAEALAAPEVVWSLIDGGYTVVGITRSGRPTALSHSCLITLHQIPSPETGVEQARNALVHFLQTTRERGEFDRHVVLPLDDTAVLLCSGAAEEAGWLCCGPATNQALAFALDKRCQVEAARTAGLSVPQTHVAASRADMESCAIPFPLIVRPALAVLVSDGRAAKGRNWICSGQDELAVALKAWNDAGPMLVQPFIEGTGEGVFGLMTPNGVIAWSAHRRLRMMNPHGSGSSACVSREVDAALKAPIEAMLRQVGWRGMFMLELLRDASGNLHFIEFNGRAWGSMALARRLGLEYPAWSVQHLLGNGLMPSVPTTPREGLVCRNLGRELMHLLFVVRGRRSQALRHWPSFWAALRSVLTWHRGDSFYNWRRGDWRVFVTDCYYTIARNLAKPKRT